MKLPTQAVRWLVSLAVMTSIIASCGARPPQPEPTAQLTSTPTSTPVPPTPTLRPTITSTPTPLPTGKVSIMGWAQMQDWLQSSGVLEDFHAAYPGIEVVWTIGGPADIAAALAPTKTDQNGADAPDVVFVDDQDLPGLADQRVLADLTAWVENSETRFLPYKKQLLASGEALWALPLDSQPAALFYRRDVFQNAGLPSDPAQVAGLVSTWDGYLQVCRQINARLKLPCFASNKANNDGGLLRVMAWQSGAGLYDASGKPQINSPALAQGLDTLATFWKEKLVADNLEWTNAWYNLLGDPKSPVATAIEPMHFAADLETWIAPDAGGQWGIVPIPALADGQPRSASFGGTNLAVTSSGATGPDRKAAQAWMQFLLRPETQAKLFQHASSVPGIQPAGNAAAAAQHLDAYFGSQDPGALFAEIAAQIPASRMYGLEDMVVMDDLTQAIRLVAARQPVQAALDQAQQEVERGQEVTPTAPALPALPSETLPPG